MSHMSEWAAEHDTHDVEQCDADHYEFEQRQKREDAALIRSAVLQAELLQMIRNNQPRNTR